ncbi:MAG: sel1 repeat family protein [Burkholderiales bacterium]|nr:MAG: sel1 repeat family protein [Burkholderiales bacterium]
MMRITVLMLSVLALAACGGQDDAPKPGVEAAAEKPKPIDPKEAAEAAAAKVRADKLAEQKPEFDTALAANDEAKIDDLADAGNGWALYHRATNRLSSQDFSQQQAAFQDMEAAAEKGVADAEMWVGVKMAYGQDGYPLKPSSGLKMMERGARQGNVQAMLAVALMYEQDTFMADKKKAREWYEKAAAAGSAEGKSAIERLDGKGPATEDEEPGDSGGDAH